MTDQPLTEKMEEAYAFARDQDEDWNPMQAAARVMLEAMRMRPGVRRSGDTFAFYNIDQWLDAFAKEKGLD